MGNDVLHDGGWLGQRTAQDVWAPGRPAHEGWAENGRDVSALTGSHPMMDAVIEEIDGRMIRVGHHWLADFASCNYLGFDLDREIIAAVPGYLEAWGTHPSWSRLLGSPVLYEHIEERLARLLGCEDTLVLPTITHIHMSVIPVLAASGILMAPLPWHVLVGALMAATGFALLLDQLKRPVFSMCRMSRADR